MMPISVRDNSEAVKMGYSRANDTINRFNAGIAGAGKNFGEAVIQGRLLAAGDEPSEKLLRAAETAGISTGYMPMSVRDKVEMEQEYGNEMLRQKQEHDEQMQAAKIEADMAAKQADLFEKTKGSLSPHDRAAISLLNNGIETNSDKAKAWDVYSSVRGIKGTGADIESLAGLVGDQNAFFNELKTAIKPEAQQAVNAIIHGNLAKGIPLSFAALAQAIGGSEPDKLKFQNAFQSIAQKHLDPNKLTAALQEIYYPEQIEAYRQGMELQQEPQQEQITEQQFENHLNSMDDEQLTAFMKRMGMI
jgi:hypothetical protein